MKKSIIKFFDKVEDRVRVRLSHRAIIYAFIGGVFTVIFWRGVWMTVDKIGDLGPLMKFIVSGPVSLILSASVLLVTGLFVSVFIGEKIIISGLKKEKKTFDKTENEIREESSLLLEIKLAINKINQDMIEIKEEIKRKSNYERDKNSNTQ